MNRQVSVATPGRTPRFVVGLFWAGGGLGLVAVAAILGYSLLNSSHHTGWEPFSSFILFVPLVLCGSAAVLARSTRPALLVPGLVAILAGLLGLAVVVYLDQSNRLVQYDRWIQRGMP